MPRSKKKKAPPPHTSSPANPPPELQAAGSNIEVNETERQSNIVMATPSIPQATTGQPTTTTKTNLITPQRNMRQQATYGTTLPRRGLAIMQQENAGTARGRWMPRPQTVPPCHGGTWTNVPTTSAANGKH
ncbi:hypothetical protein MJO29_011316 [Puccinia striiformis f. sp. tritici]|nr:hypothetical protein MJO29_011316 [Puccinia striiformis f. sp. tritici]